METHSDETNVTTSNALDWGQEKPMNTSPVPSEEKRFDTTAIGSSVAQLLAGLAAIVLAIVGLAHVEPQYVLAIAVLVVGAALILQGGNTFLEFANLLPKQSARRVGQSAVGNSVNAEILAGFAGIILGILSLVSVFPDVLLPVAAIVFGGALIFTSGDVSRVNMLKVEQATTDETFQQLARQSFSMGGGPQALIGLTAIILGIVALAGYHWAVLSLVALLVLGAIVLISSTAITEGVLAVTET
jgi:hypothetical protein